MLKDRLKTSAVLISIVAVLLHMDAHHSVPGAQGLWLLPLLLFFGLGTASDISQLLAGSGRPIRRGPTLVATAMVTLSAYLPSLWPLFGSAYPVNCPVGRLGWIVIAAIAGVFWILVSEMRRYGREPKESDATSTPPTPPTPSGSVANSGTIERTSAGVFVSLYVGLPMALLVALRTMNGSTHGDNWGLAALLTMIAVTKSTDAGAYFSGKAFGGKLLGKEKLIPRLSPGKTREGAVGGIVTATIVAFVCLAWLFPAISGPVPETAPPASIAALSVPIWGALVLGPILAVSGMVGDLAESLVKRDSGAKDSGNWLPGLGGVWDVTDSLIAAVMPAFLCFAAGVGS
ncbi:MAG: phosphatidate cytidylyltransferase [Pirellulaceae bacterium]|nr:phosphatidate cytidylyltransferase [Pirellulaceae bacterium]